jgi:hypothetical protein
MQVRDFVTPERHLRRDELVTELRTRASKDLVDLGERLAETIGKRILANCDALEESFKADEW